MSDPERERRVRMDFEKRTLRKFLPGCDIWERRQELYVDYRIETTEPKGVFQLRVHASPQFPCAQPSLYVMVPKILRMHSGETPLNQIAGASHAFHKAGNSPDGHVAICHHLGWNASISLFEVLRKGLLWLKLYNRYLQTGKTIDELLKLEPPETQENLRATAT